MTPLKIVWKWFFRIFASFSRIFFSDDDKGPECWICYDPDKTDAGPMIRPCDCRGDVSAVHHDCLRRWLVEVTTN